MIVNKFPSLLRYKAIQSRLFNCRAEIASYLAMTGFLLWHEGRCTAYPIKIFIIAYAYHFTTA